MREEATQQLIDFCGISMQDLQNLGDQLTKIIKIKQMNSGNSNQVLSQVAALAKTVENLEKINTLLPPAIREIKELGQQVELLLRNEIGLKSKQ